MRALSEKQRIYRKRMVIPRRLAIRTGPEQRLVISTDPEGRTTKAPVL
jgi:hypothetical protein